MKIEIERKFLIDHRLLLPVDEDFCQPKFIEQAYISLDTPCTRIRIVDGKEAYLTFKGAGLLSRKEFEYDLPVSDAREIMQMSSHVVKKTRRYIKYADNLWELDNFGDDFYIAELELNSEDQKFTKPSWVLREVTKDKRYTNVYISQFGFPKEV